MNASEVASRATPAAMTAAANPATRTLDRRESFIPWLVLEADKCADARVRIAEHVLARRELAAHEHVALGLAVACVDLLCGFVIAGRVVLVVQQSIRSLD